MPQFFIDKKFSVGCEVDIRGSEARHISQVLRLEVGDWIILSDGEGRSFRAVIASSTPRSVNAKVYEEVKRRESAEPPTVALALVKGDRFEWAIQKLIELGCRRIIPFRSARCVPQYAESATAKKLERWAKIAHAAAKQSGLPFMPQVEKPRNLGDILGMRRDFGRIVLFYEGEKKRDMRSLWKTKPQAEKELLIIGPEGGFTKDEVAQATASGAATVSLGQQILRVETAAIAAMTIWQYGLGNLDVDQAK